MAEESCLPELQAESDSMEPVFIILGIAIVIGLVAYTSWETAQRRKKLAAWAVAKNLVFSPERDRGLDDRHSHFKCLQQGHSRFASNVMRGELVGFPVIAFDFRYVTGHGKNRREHKISALIMRSVLPLRPLYIRGEHIFDKVAEFFGADDIDFESAEFSKKFYVKAADKKWAYAVIHQGMMEYLLQSPQFSIQLDRDEIIVWRSRRFQPEDFEAAAELIRNMLNLLPGYLVQELEGER